MRKGKPSVASRSTGAFPTGSDGGEVAGAPRAADAEETLRNSRRQEFDRMGKNHRLRTPTAEHAA